MSRQPVAVTKAPLLLAGVLLLMALSFGLAPQAFAGALDEIFDRGEIRFGYWDIPPWGYQESGQLKGHQIDIGRRLAADIGVTAKFVGMQPREVFGALEAGEVDVFLGADITAQRARRFVFAAPLESYAVGVAFSRAKLPVVKALEDINQDGMLVGMPTGTSLENLARERFDRATLIAYETRSELESKLASGEVHAAVMPAPWPYLLSKRFPESIHHLRNVSIGRLFWGLVVRPESFDLLRYLDHWSTINRGQDWLKESYNYYFSSFDWEPSSE